MLGSRVSMKYILCLISMLFVRVSAAQNDLFWPGSPALCRLFFPATKLETIAALPYPLPVLKQDTGGKCGPASLAIALVYSGKLALAPPYDGLNLVNEVYAMALQQATASGFVKHLMTQYHSVLVAGMAVNSSFTLAEVAKQFGLDAHAQMSTLNEIKDFVKMQDVVLIHWQMHLNQPSNQHWSVIQSFGNGYLELRDPWPENPSNHWRELSDFSQRNTTGRAGYFHVVRIVNPHR